MERKGRSGIEGNVCLVPVKLIVRVCAKSAVEDRLSLQPKEPSKEERMAELNAEQARRIEELFFWPSAHAHVHA